MTTSSSPSILSLFQLTDDQLVAATARDAAISVTAGAGTGKTRALVGRYLALLEEGLPLRSLVAITFTDKAAREMRNRVRVAITDWLERGVASDRKLWDDAFSAMDAARISTIHGLCAAILRAHPAEAGLDPAFGVLEEGRSAVWRARAVEEGLAWATTQPDVARLFGAFQEERLRRLLADLLANRLDAEQTFAQSPEDPLGRWATALDSWLTDQFSAPPWREALETLATLQAQKPDDKLETARRAVLSCWTEARQAQAEGDWDSVFAALLALRKAIASGGRKGNWAADDLVATREAMRALRAHFDQVVSQVLDKRKPVSWDLDRQVAQLLPLVRRVFERTCGIYRGYKSEAYVLDFDDLEHMTAQLLATHQALRARWQAEIRAIMVDEFQDTNQRQRQIVYALTGFDPSSAGTGRPPAIGRAQRAALTSDLTFPAPHSSLFVVGDAKQSIYRFRGADVTVFRQVQADIRAAGGTLINLDLTFRAHQALVDISNALLAPLMPADDDPSRPYDVSFAPLTAHRPAPRAGTTDPYLEFQLGLGDNRNEGRLAAAAGLAQRLHQLHDAGQLEWQDVALLFRASTAFGFYEDALEEAGIPFVTVAGRGFYDRPEVRDLLNALAAIADPTDDLAMAGLLRSPTIGLSDEALYLLRWEENRTRRPFWTALQSGTLAELGQDDRTWAEFARRLIADLHRQAGRVSVAQLLKAFLDATHFRAALGLVPEGERLRRNVDKLLADAHRSELVSVAEFLEYVTALRDVAAREGEAPTEAGGAVQLMTIHKAKGLEFPVVVLADASHSGGSRLAPFYLDQELGLMLDLSDGNAQPAAFRLAAWREAQQSAAEERRLLYVAATRAREKLIISGSARLSASASNAGRLLTRGWLAQLAEVVGLNETQLPEMPTNPQSVPLAWEDGRATCTLHPPVPATPPRARPVRAATGVGDAQETPDLLAPLSEMGPAGAVAHHANGDEKLHTREGDPPPRVWRVVPKTKTEVPAWVIGSLTHIALRHWRFPDDQGFADFLTPFALEVGLTDEAGIRAALRRVTKLLTRFQTHSLYAELSAAERHPEVPYTLTLNGQTRSGIIDLLFRSSPDEPWTIAEFKTDRLAESTDLTLYIQQQGYEHQVRSYVQAVAQQTGATPRALLVFLSVGNSIRVRSL